MRADEAYILARAYAKKHGGGGGTGGDTYTKEEIDTKISALEQEIEWKESVATVADLETTYPSPNVGWTASADDTGRIYRWNGEEWVDIYSVLPTATEEVDGMMSSGYVTELKAATENIEELREQTFPVALTDAEVAALWENASAYMRNIPMTKQSSWNVSAETPTTYAQENRARITNIIPQKSTERFVFGMSSAGTLYSNVQIRVARFNSDNTSNLSSGSWVDISENTANLAYTTADSNIVINFMIDVNGDTSATITDAILAELQTKFYIKKEAI